MPQHVQASGWRAQIRDALEVVESMKGINPVSSKSRDVITSLCGDNLQDPDSPPLQYVSSNTSERARDATVWMAGCAPTLINEDLWAGSLDNSIPDFEFGDWDAWNL